jgi:MFS family permease
MAFGAVMLGSGWVPNWWTLAILRVPLGAFEGLSNSTPSPHRKSADSIGILFPGCIFLISSWYPRYETQKRISAFYLGGQFVSGFGNIIAYGFSYVSLFSSEKDLTI